MSDKADNAKGITLGYFELLHNGPFGREWQFLDSVEIISETSAVGTVEYRPFGNLLGHFDRAKGLPTIMPGVIIIEIGCDVAAVLFRKKGGDETKVAVLGEILSFKFLDAVKPGDQLVIKVEVVEFRHGKATIDIEVTKDGAETTTGEGRVTARLVDKERLLKPLE